CCAHDSFLPDCDVRRACRLFVFFFSSRRRHTRFSRDWSSDVCSSDLAGCRRVYHAGDVIAGERVYSGQQYDLFLVGLDRQVDYVVEHYPSDLPTTFITGNHDLAYLKTVGIDPGRAIARERPDMEYIGQWARRVEIAPGIFLDLTHG